MATSGLTTGLSRNSEKCEAKEMMTGERTKTMANGKGWKEDGRME